MRRALFVAFLSLIPATALAQQVPPPSRPATPSQASVVSPAKPPPASAVAPATPQPMPTASPGTVAEPRAARDEVPVQFVSASGEWKFIVTAEGKEQGCATPCTLRISPGVHTLHVEGDASYDQEVDVQGPTTFAVQKRRVGRLVLGLVSLGVGVPLAIVGVEVAVLAAVGKADTTRSGAVYDVALGVGCGLAVAGAALATVGGIIGFSTFGHNQLSAAPPEHEASAPKLRLVGLGAAPLAGGFSTAAVFQF